MCCSGAPVKFNFPNGLTIIVIGVLRCARVVLGHHTFPCKILYAQPEHTKRKCSEDSTMDQLILLPSILLHQDNRLVQDDLAALSWPGCTNVSRDGGGGSSGSGGSRATTARASFSGTRLTFTGNGTFYVCKQPTKYL